MKFENKYSLYMASLSFTNDQWLANNGFSNSSLCSLVNRLG